MCIHPTPVMQNGRTTIAVHRDTIQRLGEVGRFNESYEDVIVRLLDARAVEKVGSES